MARAIRSETVLAGPGDAVIVTFDDGHKVIFFPNWGGFGDPACIQEMCLRGPDDNNRAQFYSPRQYPSVRKPYGFQHVPAGADLTTNVVLEYFTLAYEFVRDGYGVEMSERKLDGPFLAQWRYVNMALRDIEDIEEGGFAVPTSTQT